MFVGWRMADDLEILSELPDGTLNLDLLTGQVTHSIEGCLNLHIAKEIQTWLEEQGNKEGIDISQLLIASLEVRIDTSKVATNKKRVVMFTFFCKSLLKTNEVEYASELNDMSTWHNRV